MIKCKKKKKKQQTRAAEQAPLELQRFHNRFQWRPDYVGLID